jgi:PAS domain S-box/diguanylate cyclase (GGDEF) domain
MKALSAISIIASIVYLYVGFKTYKLNKRSKECMVFLILNISMAIWAFAYAFAYTAENSYVFSFWNKISALGWCTFSALILYLVLLITENKLVNNKLVVIFIFSPAPIFLFMSVFLFGPTIKTYDLINTLFYTGNFLYNFGYLIISIIVMYFWGRKTDNSNKKKQSKIIVIASLTPFLLNLLTQHLIPILVKSTLPNMGQIYSLIMLYGVYYAITKYQFMQIPTSLITKELFSEIMDFAFLTDLNGAIIRVNKHACELLGYTEKELVNSSITNLIEVNAFKKVILNCSKVFDTIKFNEIHIAAKGDLLIPLNISVAPLVESNTKALLGILIVGQDIRIIRDLKKEITKHKQTSERLIRSEELFRNMIEIMPYAVVLTNRNDDTILYVNNKAEELFNTSKSEMIGDYARNYYANSEDRTTVINALLYGKPVKEKEILFRRKDNSLITGLLTTVIAMYDDRHILLSCITDITEIKKDQERSIRDGLTNLYNHQRMIELLESELIKAVRLKQDLCVMMIDIDFFKKVNDTYGHQIGDKVLIAISHIIQLNVRAIDYVGRYGGEEFIVILPNINEGDACKIAENLRLSIQNFKFEVNTLKVTVSIGIAQFNQEEAKELINKADIMLYQAKKNGRNRIETYNTQLLSS